MAELFDTHAHLDFPAFDEDRDEVIGRAREAGVRRIVTIGSGGGTESSRRAIAVADTDPDIWATVGVHPHDAKLMDEDAIAGLAELAKANSKVVGLGEIGLDYAKMYSEKDVQMKWFRRQLDLAKELDLPVIIHDRDAHDDLMKVLKEDGIGEAGGIMHCYSGGPDLAKELVEMGFYISFPGVITFKNAKKAPEVVEAVPKDRILIETDCPFLAPHPYRGKRNEPAYVKYVAEAIAKIKGDPYERIARMTTDNAVRAFGICN